MIGYLTKPLFQYLPQDLAALAAAMIWGQKQFLNPQQYQVWQTTGLLHLLVLSGQNITLLVGFVQIFGKRLGTRFGLTVTVLIAGFYLLVFGHEAPIVRAGIMAVLSSLALFSQNTAPPLYLLGLTTMLMLIIQPEWINSLSFQLSIAATAGILYFYPYFQARLRFRCDLAKAFFLSLSAQILTTPLILLNFRQISLLALPLNAAVSFLIEPIMFVGVVLSLTGNWLEVLGPILSLVLLGLLSTLNGLVNLAYRLGQNWVLQI